MQTLKLPKNGTVDLTLRMQDELGLFHEIAQQASSAIIVTNLSGDIIYVNDSFTEYSGYTYDEVAGKNPRFLKSGLIPDEIYTDLWDRLKQGETWRGHFINKGKNGSLFYEEASIFPVKDKNGHNKYYAAIKKNITDLKSLEDELLSEKTILNTAVNNLQDLFFTFSKDYRFLRWNKIANDLLGYSDDEITKMNPFDFVHRDDHASMREGLQKVMSNGSNKNILRVITKDRQMMTVEFYTTAIKKNNEVVAFAGIGRDISKKVDAEEERGRLFEVAQELIGIISMDGYCKELNPAWENLLGWSRAELETEHIISFIHRNDQKVTQAALDELATGKKITGLVNRFQCKDGSFKWLNWNATPYPQRNSIYLFARDITQEQELQQQLLHTQKMEAIGTLAGGIAHDFNNILGAIVGYAQLVKFDPTSVNNEIYIDQVLIAGERARDLVGQILAFSRKKEFKLEQLKVSTLVKEVIKLIKGSVPSTIKINYDIEDLDGIILGDFTQIHQVLMNVLTNAYQAIHPDTGQIDLYLGKTYINAKNGHSGIPLPRGEYVKITIKDSGPGIEPEIISKIFDPFFTTKENGTGMGLAVVDGLVKSHGGHVALTSKKGKGSTFEIYLPRQNVSTAKIVEKDPLVIHGNAKIVIIDDEKSILDVTDQLLSNLGYDIKTYQNPLNALDYLRDNSHNADLVLTDLMMPELKGDKLVRILKEFNKEIPVIIMTGYNEQDSLNKMRADGINEIIRKPFSAQSLSKTIHDVINKK